MTTAVGSSSHHVDQVTLFFRHHFLFPIEFERSVVLFAVVILGTALAPSVELSKVIGRDRRRGCGGGGGGVGGETARI